MQSISAKELRLDMKNILLKVERGQSFEVIYHSRPIGNFVPKIKKTVTKDWYRDLLELRKNLSVNKTKKRFDWLEELKRISKNLKINKSKKLMSAVDLIRQERD